jgi:hypothetical protein
MRIDITREAVCAADDQCGPLEMVAEIEPSGSIQDLVGVIESSRFLQFSSSHTSIVGFVGGIPVVRVFSPHHSRNKAEYFLPEHSGVAEVIGSGRLDFKF